VSLSVGVST